MQYFITRVHRVQSFITRVHRVQSCITSVQRVQSCVAAGSAAVNGKLVAASWGGRRRTLAVFGETRSEAFSHVLHLFLSLWGFGDHHVYNILV